MSESSAAPDTAARVAQLVEEGLAALGRAEKDAADRIFSEAVALDENHVDAWLYLGIALAPYDQARATEALERALALSPENPGALYWLAETRWVHVSPASAVPFLERMVATAPDSPQMVSRLGYAQLAAGEVDEAHATFSRAADAGGGANAVDTDSSELRRAFYLNLAGRGDEAAALVARVNESGPDEPPAALYPIDFERQRCALEDVVAGRDIVIMGSGPSLETLPEALEGLDESALDELCFFGFNNVPVAEAMLRESVNREVDLACMTSGTVIRIHAEWVESFLARPAGSNLFLTLMSAVNAFDENGALLNDARHRSFYFNSAGDHPPTAADPLHFPPINTLLCVLPLAMLARPRRIFLFGCDGALDPGTEDRGVYFRQGDEAYGDQAPPRTDAYSNWLVRDTFFFNTLIPTITQSMSELLKIPVPEIVNCNPASSYQHFPRISPDAFRDLARTPPTRIEGYHPARLDQAHRQVARLEKRMQIMDAAHATELEALRAEMRAMNLVTMARRTAGRIKRRLLPPRTPTD